MKSAKRAKLEAAGWAVGSVKEFLSLSDAEEALITMKLGLSRSLCDRRKKCGLTQVQLAEQLQSSQSRVAKMEAKDNRRHRVSRSTCVREGSYAAGNGAI